MAGAFTLADLLAQHAELLRIRAEYARAGDPGLLIEGMDVIIAETAMEIERLRSRPRLSLVTDGAEP